MTTGLARAALRSRPASFAGVWGVLVFSSTVVTASTAVAVSSPGGEVAEMGLVFTLVTVYMSVFVVGQTAALAVTQRLPENALLRAVGAGPWQIRRSVVAATLLVALAALPVGWGAGAVLGRVWWKVMDGQGLLPAGRGLEVGPGALAAAAAVAVGAGLLGGLLASGRAARSRPAVLLGEAAVPAGGSGRVTAVRTVAALLAAGGATALALSGRSRPAADAAEQIPLVLLAYLVAVALAGPVLGRTAAALTRPLLHRCGAAGESAAAHLRHGSRRLSPAVTPVALAVAFTLVKSAALAGTGPVDPTEVFGTALYAAFAGLVAANTAAMLAAERREEVALLRSVGATGAQVCTARVLEGLVTAAVGTAAGVGTALAVTLPVADRLGVTLGALPGWAWPVTAVAVAAVVVLPGLVPTARQLGAVRLPRPQAGAGAVSTGGR